MKLRIGGNSVRLRLLRSEVARLRRGDRLQETVEFGSSAQLKYALESYDGSCLAAQFVDGEVLVSLPAVDVRAWADSEQVGLYGDQAVPGHGSLAIAVEKDFACLDRSDADNADTFAHPNAEAGC